MKNTIRLIQIISAFGFLIGCNGPSAASDKNDKAVPEKAASKKVASKKVAPKKADAQKRKGTAPKKYAVKLKTTKGNIVIDVERAWSPHGADRFYELVTSGYYTDVAFFRVIDRFMAQAGISGDPEVNKKWRNRGIKDDPVKKSNTRGMVTFAMSGRPNSRTVQFFINYKDNSNLDGMRFAPFGKVRDMKAADALYKGYGEGAPRGSGPNQGEIQRKGNAYLKKEFPKLDYILSAEVLK